ncbi:uncharacterized protein IL334_006894 [Kwoniella shivajii]|uniref:Monooxygenase n=1 Tax=Kwoniella shivajii TaxID=564305 RepID=A0ABZ1D7P2_9TREE|nr:hypothetical protein IL334_006894 [Kwoniella shivajii]
MHIAIVGAGYSGLVTASTLISFGHTVVIFDSAPDVGGVWSATRYYPGLKAQNTKDTYCFSTLPMPEEYSLHPDGQQVQAYLETFVRKNGLDKEGRLKLNVEVVQAEKGDSGWIIQIRSKQDDQTKSYFFDYLICATGIFNQPHIPYLRGANDFVAAGGVILHSSNFHHLSSIKDKNVVVVGYGKSACDAAVSVATSAKSVTIVARNIIWKLPTYVGGVLHFSLLLLTRFGEALFPFIRPWKSQRFLNCGMRVYFRNLLFTVLSWIITIQMRLDEFQIHPHKPFETIARSSISLASAGFVDAMSKGDIKVEREVTVESLSPRNVTLSSGKELSADVIICGTGWKQNIPSFISAQLADTLKDKNGDWLLYRHVFPIDIEDLAFIGFNSSIFCPLTAEITSIWLAAHLRTDEQDPLLVLTSRHQQRQKTAEEVTWHRERTEGHHASGTSIVPFSMSNIDEMLGDLEVEIGWLDYMREWVLPIRPSAYRYILPTVLQRVNAGRKEKIA